MLVYLLTIASEVTATWVAVVLMAGRLLVRAPRRHHAARHLPPQRQVSRRRDDFTLVS